MLAGLWPPAQQLLLLLPTSLRPPAPKPRAGLAGGGRSPASIAGGTRSWGEDPGSGRAARLTQVGVVPPAELPAAAEAQVEGLLVRAPQLVAALDGSEGFLGVAVGDEAVVVPARAGRR